MTSIVRVRLHQQAFRARVIEAYRTRCAFCRLRLQEHLDAAHITADAEATGEPVVSNGSRCASCTMLRLIDTS
jgi:putative restriction endonuclease